LSTRTEAALCGEGRPIPATSADRFFGRIRRFVHRNRIAAAVYEGLQSRRRDRAFAAHLDRSIGVAVNWSDGKAVRSIAAAEVERLLTMRDTVIRKGSPPLDRLRAADLQMLRGVLSAACNGPLQQDAMTAAARVASLAPADGGAFVLYLACLWLQNETTLRALRGSLASRIVLHLTCQPRLARAEASIASFPAQRDLSHLKLVGAGTEYRLDARSLSLGVPSGDGYECLPQKVFHGLALLTLACNPQGILKIDDDHRLRSASALDALFADASSAREPLQFGAINRTPLPAAHHRAWHFGKCAAAESNSRILEMPTPARWAAGSAGYLLNRPALWRILWASLYYRGWLDAILYEDIALAEVATKTGIRLVQAPMSQAIAAVAEY
jgi:hypothetical protein